MAGQEVQLLETYMKDSMELILESLCIGLVYVTDCEGDPAFKPGVVRGQVAKIKNAIAVAESMLTASDTRHSAEPAGTSPDPSASP